MKIHKLINKEFFSSNCYILIFDGKFAVIDPSVSYSDALAALPELAECELGAVLLTHGHIDHIWEINSYAAEGAPIYVSESDSKILEDRVANCSVFIRGPITGYSGEVNTVSDKDVICLGDLRISVIETPGHTRGSLCYHAQDVLFTGDTLLSGGGFGRTDLPGGDMIALIDSIRKIFKLNSDIMIYPGHGESSYLGSNKKNI